MTYTALAVGGVAVAVAVDLGVLRTRLLLRRVFWAAYAIVLGAQLIANGVLTGRGVVRYDPATITGVRIAHAPVEDVLFGFALVLLTQSLWVWQGRRGRRWGRRAPVAGARASGRGRRPPG